MSNIAVSTVIEDAEKIAGELVPPAAVVPRVLGVLIQHVNQFAKSATGKEIESLAEDILGIAPPAAPAEPTADAAELATLKEQMAKLEAKIDGSKGSGA